MKKIFWILHLALIAGFASAAPITWETPVDVSAASDVMAEGTLIEATNAGAPSLGSLTVNGVTFISDDSLLPQNAVTSRFNGDTGDLNYNTILDSLDWNSSGGKVALTLGGGDLVPGTEYKIQVWYADTQKITRNLLCGDGEPTENTATLGATGQYAIGTFTADGTTQTLTSEGIGFNAHLTAYQIRMPGPALEPTVPTGLTATNGFTDEILLDWDDNTQGTSFSRFIVKRSLSPGGPYTAIPGAEPTESQYTDTGLETGETYYYVVRAVNIDGVESADSEAAFATAAIFVPDTPTVPTGLEVRPGSHRVHLQWTMNTQLGFKEFRVKRAPASGGPYSSIGTTTDTTFIDTSALNGVTYYYVVTAVNVDDVESGPSTEQAVTPSVTAEPPNFLFIIADDMDTYAVNAYRETEPVEMDAQGNPYPIDTPNLDRLAEEGMLFHQARLMGADSAAVCRPSRTTIMTGRSTWEQFAPAASTFPGIFNRGERSGADPVPYATYRTCKDGNSYNVANAEFTVVNDATKRGNTDGNGSEWHADRGVEYLEDWAQNHQNEGKPFFIYLGFSHPHDRRNAREDPDLTGRYGCINTSDPGGIVLNTDAPPLPANHLSCTPATFPAHPFDNGDLDVRDEVRVRGVGQYRTEAVIRNEIGRNFACVDWMDQQMGRVIDRLEDPNGDGDTSDSVVGNTYVVFTSDHGIAIGRHGLQGKQNLYEHTWRVPYIVRGPGIAAGSETDAMIYLHETFPTFCDLAGLDIPTTIDGNDGQSFRAVLEGAADEHHDAIYGLYAGGDKPGIRAVTDGRFKLIKYDVAGNNTQVTQLFDLQENPFELLPEHGVPNLADQPAYSMIRQNLETKLMEKRILFADPYAFLGDRALLRFENNLSDSLPFGNDGTAVNGPVFSTDVPHSTDYVMGESNTSSLDLEQDLSQHVEVPNSPSVGFGNNPFTIEAWVRLESLPTSNDLASAMPVVQKKVIGAEDAGLDYLFLAAAGNYGSASNYNCMALHVGSDIAISTLSIPDTDWHYISVSLDPTTNTVRFQLDDAVDVQPFSASGSTNSGPLIIGAHFAANGQVDSAFDGRIDELSITDGFLSETERQPLLNQPTPLPARLHAPILSNSSINLTFDSSASFLYDVESKERLTDPEWMLMREFVWSPGDQITVELQENPLPDSGFYRIRTRAPVE